MKSDKKDLLLYAVTDRRWLNGASLCGQVEQAILGGATFIQLREKEMDRTDLLKEAIEIRELCGRYHVPFVLDDDAETALKAGADGVRVGQSDMEAGNVREMIGKNMILGVSAQTVEQAVMAEKHGADYLGVGAVFPTGSKSDADDVSMDTLQKICAAVSIPVIAIGGITRNNVMQLSGSGICGVAVISAIFAEKDIRKAAADLRSLTEKMVGSC